MAVATMWFRCSIMFGAVIGLALAVEVAAAQDATPVATPGPSGVVTSAAGVSLRGARYCEILAPAASTDSSGRAVTVYTTQGLNDCPAELWDVLEPATVARELGVPVVFRNGPRYLAYDRISATIPEGSTVLGGLEMHPVATLELPAGVTPASSLPYAEMRVARTTTYTFEAGKPVFELVAPNGRVYVMQTYVGEMHPGSDLTGLATLGERLTLPEGWQFRSVTPAEDLAVVAVDGVATVVRDDLGNTYQLLEGPA